MGAVIAILPGAPVRFAPESDIVCEVELAPVVTDPNELAVPKVNAGEAPPEHALAAVALLRGATERSSKSVLLLFASVHPLFLRNIDCAVVIPVVTNGLVSEQFGVPKPSTSIALLDVHPDAPESGVILFTNATLPDVPLRLIVVLVKSGVGKAIPVAPLDKATRKYFPGAILVEAGMAATAQDPVPVAELY